MAEIKLSKGYTAIVDDEDLPLINAYKWHASEKTKGYFYASTNISNGTSMLMHRLLMQVNTRDVLVDHINGNTLDNRRENLRLSSRSQNLANRKSAVTSVSKYLGVSPHYGSWRAQISIKGRTKHIGTFKNEIDAAIAYNKVAKSAHGEFANLNVISQ